jgi:hypothetical protein
MAAEMIDKLFFESHPPETLAACLTDDRLIVGASVDEVKAVLQREQRGKTLAESDDHKALLRNAKPIGNVRLVVNLPQIIEAAKAAAEEEEERDELKTKLKIIGADSLGSVVGHWHAGAAGYDSKLEALFLMHGERSGLAKILTMENRPTAPPATVAADSCVYAGLNVKVPELVDEIERLVRVSDPEEADAMRQSLEELELPNGDKFNPRKDFIAHLRGPFQISLAFAKPLAADSARLLLSIGHRDQNAMNRFLSAMTDTFETREVRGTQLYDSKEQKGFSVAPTSDRLVAGTAKAVAGALEPAAGEPLAGTEAWKQAAKHLPEEAWFTLFIDQRKLMEVALEAAKSPEQFMAGGFPPDMGSMILMTVTQGLVGEVKAEDQDKARKLLKYSAPTVFTVSTAPDGLRITQIGLKPAE